MSQDEIDASRAPLLDHLIELRQRLMYSIGFLAVGFVVCYIFSEPLYQFLARPLHDVCLANLPDGSDPSRCRLIITAPQEAFFTYLKLSLFGGFCLTFPLIAAQVWMFVAPGLYKEERRAFLPFLVATPVLFLIGASLVYFLIMPLALGFFFGFTGGGGEGALAIELETRVSEYFGLIMTLILAFGICFQLPVLLLLLARVGLATSQGLKEKRKYAIVGVFAMAAILTPPDPISQLGLALPILLLYEISIYLVRRVEDRREAEDIDGELA